MQRFLLKISGEALSGSNESGIDMNYVNNLASYIKKSLNENFQLSIVIGGGNFWRGRDAKGLDRVHSDHIGMLGTVINSLALSGALESINVKNRVVSSVQISGIAESYSISEVNSFLNDNNVIIFACGLGHPYLSTDTTAALRAAEIGANTILVAKNGVDGVYSDDPKINKSAKKFDKISFSDILSKKLKVLDASATSICMENQISLKIFGIDDLNNIIKALSGEDIGTIVKEF